jgi:ssDNA thymidine ADP-ribosyltransferase, DarT
MYLARFFSRLDQLGEVNWEAVAAADFRDMVVKEGKQAEFLIYDSFPWPLVEEIGVCSATSLSQVEQAIAKSDHRPVVAVQPEWYY